MIDPTDNRFEDELSPFARKARRMGRAIRWAVKGALSRPRTVLVETRWRLGDEVMALPLYEALKTKWPDTRVSMLCNYPDLVTGNPHVDEVNPTSANPDRYIFLREDARSLRRIEHYAALAEIENPTSWPTLYDDTSSTESLPERRPRIAIAAGATWDTKRWPKKHWQRLIEMVREAGGSTVELGAGHEPVGGDLNLVDTTSVSEAAAIIRACDVLVTGDSGLMHLGLAAGAHVVALFGPTDAAMIVGPHPRLTVLDNKRPCRGCWNGSQEMIEPGVCPRDIAECLEPIAPEAVFAATKQITDNARTP